MATTNVIKTTIQLRRDTTENWYLFRDIVPAAGEPCFDIELGTLKIGDGVKTYGELEAIGGAGNITVAADGKSIVLEDGIFKLTGFDVAEVGAQPRKNAEGNIEWVVPSTETAEGLQSTIAGLQSDIKTLQDIVTPSEEGAQPLLTRVETLEDKVDVLNGNEYTDGSVLKIVKDEINAFATNISGDEKVNTFKELVDYVSNHNGEAATLAADILTLQELVGEDSVKDQIATAISDANKIEAIKVGDTLIDIVEKTVTIPVGAGLKASEEITIAEDGALGIGTININKIVQTQGEILVLDGGASN
jgi:hypothetical protein